MDTALVTWLAGHRSAPLDALAVLLTFVGRAGLVFIVAAVVRAWWNHRLAMAAWQTVLAAVLAILLADGVVKPIVHRARPFTASTTLETVGARPASASFPSGHAAGCFAGALLLVSTWRGARAWIWALAALVAVSRVYLGVHYPTDVLGGALLGLAAGWLVLGHTRWRVTAAETRT